MRNFALHFHDLISRKKNYINKNQKNLRNLHRYIMKINYKHES